MVSALRKSAVLWLSAVIAFATLGGCATQSAKLWSYDEGVEVEQGLRQHEAIVAQLGIYPNEDLSRYLAEVGGRLAAVSERPGLKWQFTILDSPRPHAFATRGGYVYITRGMLALLRSESDLAAVLAHEISHISTRDAVRAEVRGNIVGTGGVASSVAFPFETFLLRPYTGPWAGMRMAAVNRSEEYEADRRGAENLRRAKYPLGSMSAAMEIFAGIVAFDRSQGAPPLIPLYATISDDRKPMSAMAQIAVGLEVFNHSYGAPRPVRRYGIYADYLSSMSAAGIAKELQAFNRDYGRSTPNARYRCFADDPDPEMRRLMLNKEDSWAPVPADPAFLARLDGLELGPRRQAGTEAPTRPVVLRIRKVQEGDTFASLAMAAHARPRSEVVLRLLNQRYPRGELEVGQLVKVIE